MNSTRMLEATEKFLQSCFDMLSDPTSMWYNEWVTATSEVKRLRTLPEIVCLCGSGRFVQQFQDANLQLSVEGKIVLSIGADNLHTESNIRVDEPAKTMLDALHFRKIDLCDRVHVLNINGYIGKNTLAEIRYAVRNDKAVTFVEDECWLWSQEKLSERMSVAHFMGVVRSEEASDKQA